MHKISVLMCLIFLATRQLCVAQTEGFGTPEDTLAVKVHEAPKNFISPGFWYAPKGQVPIPWTIFSIGGVDGEIRFNFDHVKALSLYLGGTLKSKGGNFSYTPKFGFTIGSSDSVNSIGMLNTLAYKKGRGVYSLNVQGNMPIVKTTPFHFYSRLDLERKFYENEERKILLKFGLSQQNIYDPGKYFSGKVGCSVFFSFRDFYTWNFLWLGQTDDGKILKSSPHVLVGGGYNIKF